MLGTVNAKPCGWSPRRRSALTAPARDGFGWETKKRALMSNKEPTKEERCAALLKLLDKKSAIQGVQSLL